MKLQWEGRAETAKFIQQIKTDVSPLEFETGNLLVEGDNLEVLQRLGLTHRGQFACIYIDPPYNTLKRGFGYNDSANSPQLLEWLNHHVGFIPKDPSDRWLCVMWPRLHLMRQLLKTEGALFISINNCEVHHLSILCDQIFGEGNRLQNFVWHFKASPCNNIKGFGSVTEYILAYAFDKSRFEWQSKESEQNGLFDDAESMESVWIYTDVGSTGEATNELNALFPECPGFFSTPKPTRLLQHILEIASCPGDLVLDAFAGSGSFGHAVLKLNAQSPRKATRRFMLIETDSEIARTKTKARLESAIQGNQKIKGTGGAFRYVRHSTR